MRKCQYGEQEALCSALQRLLAVAGAVVASEGDEVPRLVRRDLHVSRHAQRPRMRSQPWALMRCSRAALPR